VDREGVLRVPEGLRMSYDALVTMGWAVKGVVGP